MILTTEWLGLHLRSPVVPSASPLTRSLDAARRLEDAGAGALVMHSLFEEAVRQNEGDGSAPIEAADVANDDFPGELDRYLEQVAALKASLEIPIIASLNGVTAAGWMNNARHIADAGADALELNAYYVAGDVWEEGHYVEQRYITLLNALREQVEIPINLKLSPAFSSIGNVVKKLEAAGAAGVCLFNRLYQPDIDTDRLELRHSLAAGGDAELLLAMRWIAILRGRVSCSLGASGGVRCAADAIKLLLAGSDVIHLCQALLRGGPGVLQEMQRGLETWMTQQGFSSLSDFRGRLGQASLADPSDDERANYIRILRNYRDESGHWG